MSLQAGSRHLSSLGVQDEARRWFLTERVPYHYRPHEDNRVHVIEQGDTLWNLAGKYFAPLPRACGFWWVIADFQPTPLLDPTQELEPGTEIVIPSMRVLERILSDTQLGAQK